MPPFRLQAAVRAGERVLLALWAGAMWTAGYIAAPLLFARLDDRALAGTLAGGLFSAVAVLGLACGGLLLAAQLWRHGRHVWRRWRAVLLAAMVAVTLAGELGLKPRLAALREAGLESPAARAFGRLHGLASVLFLFNSLGGLVLVAAGPDQSRGRRSTGGSAGR